MTNRKQKSSGVDKRSGKNRSAAKKPSRKQSAQGGERTIEARLQTLEARTTALTLAVRYAAVRTLLAAKNPAAEIRRHRREMLEAIGYITSLEQAMWVHELMQFYDAVIGHFSKEKPGKHYLH